MIRHYVCFKLKDGCEQSRLEAKRVLLSMEGKVPMIKSIFVGTDQLRSARSYDVILEVLLDDMKALEDYQNDEYHCGVVKKYMHAQAQSSIALDCEV